MKFVKLLHNPTAGDAEYSVEKLAEVIESGGFSCSYSSIKKINKEPIIESAQVDMVALAGGDGTIRKAAKQLIDEHVPIGLFPMGTANNIATTLGIHEDPEEVVASWKKENIRSFDAGHITGLEHETFFLEGMGFGVFPTLMDAMKMPDKDQIPEPQERLRIAIRTLYDIVAIASGTPCTVTVDGRSLSGNYLLVEVMNTRSIGPNLELAPLADPGDGQFDVVLMSEDQRSKFLEYLSGKAEGKEKLTFFEVIRGKNVEMFWKGTTLHVDDERIDIDKPKHLSIEMEKGAFRFLVP